MEVMALKGNEDSALLQAQQQLNHDNNEKVSKQGQDAIAEEEEICEVQCAQREKTPEQIDTVKKGNVPSEAIAGDDGAKENSSNLIAPVESLFIKDRASVLELQTHEEEQEALSETKKQGMDAGAGDTTDEEIDIDEVPDSQVEAEEERVQLSGSDGCDADLETQNETQSTPFDERVEEGFPGGSCLQRSGCGD